MAAASIKTESEGPKSRTSLADVEPLALTARVPDVDDLFTTAHSPQGGAGAKMFPIASEPSLAASELCAVDSTLDHLMSIEETVSEVAFQSNPTPEPGQQSTVEKAVGESGRRASGVIAALQCFAVCIGTIPVCRPSVPVGAVARESHAVAFLSMLVAH